MGKKKKRGKDDERRGPRQTEGGRAVVAVRSYLRESDIDNSEQYVEQRYGTRVKKRDDRDMQKEILGSCFGVHNFIYGELVEPL